MYDFVEFELFCLREPVKVEIRSAAEKETFLLSEGIEIVKGDFFLYDG